MDRDNEASGATPSPPTGTNQVRLLSDAGFKLRLTLLVTLIVVGLTTLTFLLVDRVFRNLTPAVEHDLRWKVRNGLAELSHSADLGLLTNSKKLIAQASQRFADDPDILYVAFDSIDGTRVFEQGDAAYAQKAGKGEQLLESERAYSGWAPIEVEGLEVGRVQLSVSKARLRSGAKLHQRILWAGVLGAAVALGLALLFVRLYIGPTLRVTQSAFDDLKETTALAVASTKAKSQFLANMSHEIRTPMNGLLGMMHLFGQTPLSQTQKRYLDIVSGSAKSLLKIVNDILDFSKLEAQKYELAPEACDLRELIEQSVALCATRAEEKGLRLVVDVSNGFPSAALLDGDRLRQVLCNLLSNAVKFTDEGEVRVSVKAHPAAVSSGLAPDSLELEIQVSDTGIGVPPEAESTLFEAFSQVDGSSTRAHEGTGLGLTICKRLVELMEGSIEYRPATSRGSEFVVRVPFVPCEIQSSAVSTAAPPAHLTSALPILIVDDNEINQIVAMEFLEDLGLEVELAASGLEAVEAVRNRQYSLVLMDCQMPDMDGYQATQVIRGDEAPGTHVPIIACTAHAQSEERAKVTAYGMDDYVAKPIDHGELARVLRRWLRRGRSEHPRSKPSARPPSQKRLPPPPLAPGDPLREANELDILNPTRRPSPKIRALFLTNIPRELERLRQAVEQGGAAEVSAIAHKLKGSAASIGADRMAESCDRLQLSAEHMQRHELTECFGLIERLHASVRSTLEQLQAREAAAS